ncbi:MAG TPA: hypothetical protein VIP05_17075 [Burkholderiaceae bacterium]
MAKGSAIRWAQLLVFSAAAAAAAWQCERAWGWTPASIALVAGLALAAYLFGFAMYDRAYPQPERRTAAHVLHTIQVDDFGTLWDVEAARSALAEVDASWRQGNVFVVVFVHGWHHGAGPRDDNLRDFEHKLLRRLRENLDAPGRRALREKLTGSPEVKLIGLYVGWRGRSLPGWLDYLTLWGRKAAAERVGDGDVAEFIERLQRMYLRANAARRDPAPGVANPFMGLATLGHSLGAQVLLKAVARPLEFALAERARLLADVVRQPADTAADLVRVPLDSLGDVNILLNPATEAYQFARIDDLYRQLRYPAQQTPQLLVLSADDDVPRRLLFPLARWVTLPFRPPFRSRFQGNLWGCALGELLSQKTHDLGPAKPAAAPSLVDDDYVTDGGAKLRSFDFSGPTVLGRVQMTPRPGAPVAYSPVGVAVSHRGLIAGHNGIFGDDLLDFLCTWIGYVSGKRLMIHHALRAQAGGGTAAAADTGT